MFKPLAILCALFAAGTVAAQSPSSGQSAAQEISQIWQIRQKLKTPSDSVVEKQLEAILALQKKYALGSLLSVAELLLDEVRQSPSSPLENEKKISYARAFSPGTPWVDHFLCRRSFSLSAIRACVSAFETDLRTPEGRLRVSSNASMVAVVALVLMATMLLSLAVLKHAEPLTLYAEYRFPSFPRWAFFSLLFATAALGYAVFGAIGILWFAVLYLCRFLDNGERLTFAAVLLAMLVLPWLFTAPSNRIIYQTGTAPIMEAPYADFDLANRAMALENHARIHPKDALTQLTLAGLYQRLGKGDKSVEWLERAAATEPKWHKPWVNLAVIRFSEGDVDGAIDDLKKAARIDPRSVFAHFNLGKALIRETRLEEAQAALKKAKELDSQAFEELEQRSKSLGDLSLIEEGASTEELDSVIYPAHTARADEIRASLFAQTITRTPLATYLLAHLALIGWLLASLTGKIFPLPQGFLQLIRQNSAESMQPTDILNPLTAKTNLKSFNFISSLVHRIQHAWITFLVPGGPFYFHRNYLWSFLCVALSCALVAPIVAAPIVLSPPLEVFRGTIDPWVFASGAMFLAVYATLAYGWMKHGA